jgi:endogenous inhibitor of DNA gyrase (YacG/DUF329 family)
MLAVCAFCRKQPVDPAWRPFCSQRCRLQDLACWVDGRYTIPGDPVPESEDGENSDRKTRKD